MHSVDACCVVFANVSTEKADYSRMNAALAAWEFFHHFSDDDDLIGEHRRNFL